MSDVGRVVVVAQQPPKLLPDGGLGEGGVFGAVDRRSMDLGQFEVDLGAYLFGYEMLDFDG